MSADKHDEMVPVKPDYVPLLWLLFALGAPLGVLFALLVLTATGRLPWYEWGRLPGFPFSPRFWFSGWFAGLIPALATWIAVYALGLVRGAKGSLMMALAGGVLALAFGWFFYGRPNALLFGLSGLLSAALLSAFLPPTHVHRPKTVYAVKAE